jgi:hypothetical protein
MAEERSVQLLCGLPSSQGEAAHFRAVVVVAVTKLILAPAVALEHVSGFAFPNWEHPQMTPLVTSQPSALRGSRFLRAVLPSPHIDLESTSPALLSGDPVKLVKAGALAA